MTRWLLIFLVLALVAGMALTLWAGRTGRVRSRHGAVGALAPSHAALDPTSLSRA